LFFLSAVGYASS
jgi:hypothetical protein